MEAACPFETSVTHHQHCLISGKFVTFINNSVKTSNHTTNKVSLNINKEFIQDICLAYKILCNKLFIHNNLLHKILCNKLGVFESYILYELDKHIRMTTVKKTQIKKPESARCAAMMSKTSMLSSSDSYLESLLSRCTEFIF